MTDNRIKITTKDIFDANKRVIKIQKNGDAFYTFEKDDEAYRNRMSVDLFDITDFPADKDEVSRPVEIKVDMWGMFSNENTHAIRRFWKKYDNEFLDTEGIYWKNFRPFIAEDFIRMAKDNGIELVEKK